MSSGLTEAFFWKFYVVKALRRLGVRRVVSSTNLVRWSGTVAGLLYEPRPLRHDGWRQPGAATAAAR